MKPADFAARVDAIRRLLDNEVTVKQVGLGLLTFDPTQKEKAFAAVDRLKSDCNCILTSSLSLTFAQLKSLENEFAPWHHPRTELITGEFTQENMLDMHEMTLEKG